MAFSTIMQEVNTALNESFPYKTTIQINISCLLPIIFAAMNFSCIANADQLCALLQNTPAVWWSPVDRKSFLLFHMPIHVAASQDSSNASSHLEDMCCEASDTQDICSTTAVYSRPIFESVPFTLQKLFLLFTSTDILDYFTSGVISRVLDGTIEEIC